VKTRSVLQPVSTRQRSPQPSRSDARPVVAVLPVRASHAATWCRTVPSRVRAAVAPGSSGPGSRCLVLLLALILSIASTPGAAVAFEFIGGVWRNGSVTFRIQTEFPEAARTGDADDQIAVLTCAANAWTGQTRANFEFDFAGTTTRGPVTGDGTNSVAWVDEDGGDALAVTLIRGDGERFSSFDIAFYARSDGTINHWSGPGDPSGNEVDLRGVAVHEFGHALGLDHTNVAGATMFPAVSGTGIELRTLHADDRAGAESLYGTAPRALAAPSISAVVPETGPTSGGDPVEIRGSEYTSTADTVLRIDGRAVPRSSYLVIDCGLIVVPSMPAGQGLADIEVTNALGTATATNAYRYGGPDPVLTSVEPARGPVDGGIEITLRGTDFDDSVRFSLGSTSLADAVIIDGTTAIATLPPAAGAGSRDVVATFDGGESRLGGAFDYVTETIRVSDAVLPVGISSAPIDVLVSSDVPLKGFSFPLRYDTNRMTIERIEIDGTATDGAEFAAANIDDESGVATFGVVMSLQSNLASVPAGKDQLAARIRASVSPTAPAGSTTILDLTERGGTPPIELLFTPLESIDVLRPIGIDGEIRFTPGSSFLRGDADSSGVINITDAVFHLAALFQGGPPSPCDDAADANDDGQLDISDAVYDLAFLFTGGPPPSSPFPLEGIDPTPDELACSAGP
jgi:hypothetical protein